ncbi:hypothetical protein ET989_01750 [Propioniciclava sinopodophylli]|uniref:YdbS-like PH domain-containing protein n=1 Tax=Propioniciclava sinopodophylli TaxID=1837344 RepID=A0A4V2JSU8_9ACTN|nr:PH domain-containing protein [Propioniciclava sinopodophylli]TBT88688.1 hypothetical protein ET989_01750 [Propioniciclava sinopodophylli]
MQSQQPEFTAPTPAASPTPEPPLAQPVPAPLAAEPARTPFVPDPSLDGLPDRAVEPFAPPSDAWRRVSPKLTAVKRITSSIWLAILFIPASVAIWFLVPPEEPVRWVAVAWLALGLAWWLWLFFRSRRYVAALGWARREKDLCVVSGLMFRRLEVIPFGRMQVAKVSSGPLMQAFGLSTVELVTAGASATVPGLPSDEAKALRDLIIELSDAEGSGL